MMDFPASHVGVYRPRKAISGSKLLITNIHLALQQPQSLFWMASKTRFRHVTNMLLFMASWFPLRVFFCNTHTVVVESSRFWSDIPCDTTNCIPKLIAGRELPNFPLGRTSDDVIGQQSLSSSLANATF